MVKARTLRAGTVCSTIRAIVAVVGCAMMVLLGCGDQLVVDAPARTTTSSSEQPNVASAEVVEERVVEPESPDPGPTPAADEPIEISFDDLNISIQADIVFRPWMLNDRVKELDGKRVRIAGYMLPGISAEQIGEFVLLRNTECKFGPGGQADHLLNATLRKDETTSFSIQPIQIDGTLKVSPYEGPDGNTWSIYELHDVSDVVRVRR